MLWMILAPVLIATVIVAARSRVDSPAPPFAIESAQQGEVER